MDSGNYNIRQGGESVEDLKENFQKAKAVLAAHKIALWEYNMKTGDMYFSEDYFRILGLEAAGIFFRNIREASKFIHPEDRPIFNPEVFAERLHDLENVPEICVRVVSPQGKAIWLKEHFFSVLSRDPEGNPGRLMFYTEDVTESCESREKIRILEERNRKIVEALPEFIFIFDDNFFIRDVLMSEGTVLLHPKEELIGIDGRTVYSTEVSDLFLRNIRECLDDGQLREIEYPLDIKGKGRYYFQARIAPFENNTVLALIHDIGDRVERAAELLEAKRKAEESDKMKSFFLASMSHEIRTPLNAIIGFSEIIALTEDTAEKEEYVGIIQKNSNLLLQLINDILDLSRIESGKSEMNIQPTEMTSLIEEAEKVHQMKMRNGVRLLLEYPEKKIWTQTDRNRVMQVLFNFLSNAIKNTEAGSITLGLGEEDGWLKMFVKDTGCGIPADKLPKIFTRFEKLNDFVQGTGLGLSISQSIAECLGGRIEVESEVGKGSTFILYIPYHFVKPEMHKAKNDWRVVVPEKSGKKILVAEDTESVFIQVNTLLGGNYAISWARNGQEAVTCFLRERPDMILMDIRMPVMNGIEAIKKIRAMSPSVPIVAITAHSFYIEQQQALAAGCNQVLFKPFTSNRLEEVVSKYLTGKNLPKEI